MGVESCMVGEEPHSFVTGLYNRIMAEELPKAVARLFGINKDDPRLCQRFYADLTVRYDGLRPLVAV